MAKATFETIQALRSAAQKLSKSAQYQWGHMGSCNCGFLAQEITKLSKAEIHERAMQKPGDWSEQLNDYCPTSGLLMDDLISHLLELGFTLKDLEQLERCSNPIVLRAMPESCRYPKHNVRDEVVLYMNTWAQILEDELLEQIDLAKALSTEKSTVSL